MAAEHRRCDRLHSEALNLSPKEAAEKLAQEFGLAYDSQAPPRRRYVRQKSEAQKFKEDRDHTFRVLADYFHLLRKWETDYTPKTPEENPHPRFMEAIQRKDYVGYLLDFFLEDSPEEPKAVDCRTSIRNCQFGKESEIHG